MHERLEAVARIDTVDSRDALARVGEVLARKIRVRIVGPLLVVADDPDAIPARRFLAEVNRLERGSDPALSLVVETSGVVTQLFAFSRFPPHTRGRPDL